MIKILNEIKHRPYLPVMNDIKILYVSHVTCFNENFLMKTRHFSPREKMYIQTFDSLSKLIQKLYQFEILTSDNS